MYLLPIWCSLLSFVVSALFGRHLGSRGVFMLIISVIFYLLRLTRLVAHIVADFIYKTLTNNYINMSRSRTKFKYNMWMFLLQTVNQFDFVRVFTMLNTNNKKVTRFCPFEKGPLTPLLMYAEFMSYFFRLASLSLHLFSNIVAYFLFIYKTFTNNYLSYKKCHVEQI